MWSCLLLSGVRTEEARAIIWDEVDLKAGTVAVYRSVRVKGDTKTRKSRRVLKLPTRAVQAFRAHRTRQGRRGKSAISCSAARMERRWTAGTCGRSSRR